MATKKTVKKATKAVKAAPAKVKAALIPADYEPITMWGYFGYEFLFGIPVVGWVLCVSFALMAQNHNLRNFCRSKAIWLVIRLTLFCIFAALGGFATVCKAFNWV